MPWADFDAMLADAVRQPTRTVAVASAADQDVLIAVRDALALGLCRAILVGPGAEIAAAADAVGLDLSAVEVVEAADPKAAALEAARLCDAGRAQVLMKGQVSSGDFLKALLSPDLKLKRAPLLSHLACLEVPSLGRLLFVTDGGMVPYPDLDQKVKILNNALEALHRLGWSLPKVAVVGAVETVNPQMPPTVDAALIAKMAERGQIRGALVDGPLAFDGAVSPESCRHKGIGGPVAGEADLILVPTIEVGNVLAKSLIYCAGATMAGVVLGAAVPVVLVSRSDTPRAKLASLAMAMLSAP
ncbi:phosphate butyryltransferase [Symbiobacterium terraclitae]|uniref:Phosphate butyryltransferase n=1 Tax=Symbiobacterium terraclitae TaxID=557451 RepID=A0ABS4JT55_9FIRM|nr:phosphate butyryltransferase [Symbiobacterium terraclitae]